MPAYASDQILNNYTFVVTMGVEAMRFEWDEAKNLSNQRKARREL